MAGISTLNTLDAFTKEFYGPDWFSQVNVKTPLLSGDVVQRGGKEHLQSTPTGGREFTFPALFGLQETVAWIGDGGQYPTPGSPSGQISKITAVYHVGSIGISGPAAKLMDNNKKAFASAFELNMKANVDNFHMDWATMLYGDATACIGVVKSVTGTTTVQLTSASDLGTTIGSIAPVGPGEVTNPLYFRMNMQFTAATSRTGGTPRTGTGTISAVDPYTGKLTTTAIPTALAAGDYVFSNALGTGSILTGLLSTVDDGTYASTFQNISRSAFPYWKSPVSSNGDVARALTLGLIRSEISSILKMGGQPKFLVSDFSLRDDYIATMQGDMRFADGKEFDGGFVGAKYSAPDGRQLFWLADQYSPYGTVWFLDSDYLRHFEADKEGWDDQTGGVWRQGLALSGTTVQGYADAYWAFYRWYGNFGSYRPNTSGILRDLQE